MRTEQVDPTMSGVTCDFCHTISGYAGNIPQNGNSISEPSERKFGPFRRETNWHHVYAELQTKSAVCAVCHNAVNHHGLEIKSTFTEWKNSRYAREGIQCQDCHMTVYGFQTGGKPTYDSGQAAHMIPGSAPVRAKLYTHRFPGAHSRTQVMGAITLAIEPGSSSVPPGDELAVRVHIDHERTGHKMPSGSADLRQLWLSLDLIDCRVPANGIFTIQPILRLMTQGLTVPARRTNAWITAAPAILPAKVFARAHAVLKIPSLMPPIKTRSSPIPLWGAPREIIIAA